jgi:hypothetical protein
MKWLIRLYPREWRARYGAELEDILASRAASPGLVTDVLLGAFDARMHPHLDPLPATSRGPWLLPARLRSRLTPGLLVALAVYVVLTASLGWLRRSYGFSFGLDFFAYATYGLLPLLWLSSEPPRGLRSHGRRLLLVLPGAVLTGLVGTLLTNGWPP